MTTLKAGHDVRYFTQGSCAGGCAGAMSYYTASGEPPGQWAGKAAADLSLSGEVDPAVIQNLYMKASGPEESGCSGRGCPSRSRSARPRPWRRT